MKISKHLTYLKQHGLVESKQHQNWRIYKLPGKPSYELQRHLLCLQDCIQENKLFREDLKGLKAVTKEASAIVSQCCPSEASPRKAKNECC